MTQISIIVTTLIPATTKAGKPYEQLEVTYKDLSYNNTVKSKKIMPFGDSKNVFEALKGATNGQIFDLQTTKNSAGYIDWLAATPGTEGLSSPYISTQQGPAAQPAARSVGASSSAASPARTNTFETPEERAKKQIYIVRQSSLSAAVATLSVGGKSALKPADVIAAAREYEQFVFDTAPKQESKPSSDFEGFDDMNDDVPL